MINLQLFIVIIIPFLGSAYFTEILACDKQIACLLSNEVTYVLFLLEIFFVVVSVVIFVLEFVIFTVFYFLLSSLILVSLF
jgi:hypothetical protein